VPTMPRCRRNEQMGTLAVDREFGNSGENSGCEEVMPARTLVVLDAWPLDRQIGSGSWRRRSSYNNRPPIISPARWGAT